MASLRLALVALVALAAVANAQKYYSDKDLERLSQQWDKVCGGLGGTGSKQTPAPSRRRE